MGYIIEDIEKEKGEKVTKHRGIYLVADTQAKAILRYLEATIRTVNIRGGE